MALSYFFRYSGGIGKQHCKMMGENCIEIGNKIIRSDLDIVKPAIALHVVIFKGRDRH